MYKLIPYALLAAAASASYAWAQSSAASGGSATTGTGTSSVGTNMSGSTGGNPTTSGTGAGMGSAGVSGGGSMTSGTGIGGDTSRSGTSTSSSNTGTNADWNTENSYWRNNYDSRPYYNQSRNYSAYEPAYRYGVDLYNRNPRTRYEDLDQATLRDGWNQASGMSRLQWNDAQEATRDAYNRLYFNQTAPAAGPR